MPKGEIVGNIFIDGKGIGKRNREVAKAADETDVYRKSQGNRLKDKLNIWQIFVYVDEEPWNYVQGNRLKDKLNIWLRFVYVDE